MNASFGSWSLGGVTRDSNEWGEGRMIDKSREKGGL